MKALRVAILGAGSIAKHMAAALSLCEEMQPWAVAAREESRAKAFAQQHGFARYYGSYGAMLQDRDVDLVYLAVPHALHYDYAMMCLRAGKNVLLEKPFTANASQAEEVIDLARKKGLMAAECLWMGYLPVVEKIKGLCAGGRIGEVKMLSGEIGYHLTQERLFDPQMAGGALLDIGVYAVGLASIVFGCDVQKIVSSATFTRQGMDETNSFIFQYQDGRMASFSTSMTYMSDCRGTIWGSNGYAVIENVNRLNMIRVYDGAHQEIDCYTNPNVKNSYVFVLKSVYKALQEGWIDTPEASHADILQRMKMMDALRKQWNMVYPFEKV